MHRYLTHPLAAAVALALAGSAAAATPERNAYFGDLHLHTSLSFDAFTMKTRTLPDDSYRYAKGEEVEYFGQKFKRKAPLDFLAVTDHSEFLGVFRKLADPKGPHAGSDAFKALNDPSLEPGWKLLHEFFIEGKGKNKDSEHLSDRTIRSNWQVVVDAAEKHNKPGKFTTFVAYEWSSMPDSQNLHRNVIFRGKPPQRPFSSVDSERPEDLWAYLDKNRKEGIDALAINHNANVSNGLMFDYKDSDGKPISREYAESRVRNEPLTEVTQHKGTSETHPSLSPNDEFAGYENYEKLLATTRQGKIDGSYARQAYARGLEIAAKTGANPYKFGLAGATDFHSGISSTEEDRFAGSFGGADNNPKQVLGGTESFVGDSPAVFSAAGLTGVWAEKNTREAIFDALKRKEVFATSGNRTRVRLFAGWDLPKDLTKQKDWARVAYEKGVPMGADLPESAAGKTPRFAVQAIKDPNAANLDRIQIVKVWHKDGKSGEKVFDVAWSGKRSIDAGTGRLKEVGNTVDVKTATYRNSIGATELATVWEDPEFDAKASATYYARVLEIPTPRWSTYWAAKNKLPLSTKVPATIQERAWTSPVFYKAG
ncbi:DUF3604 domain-containing protein [Aromatoleum toluclasticum]|uniref:DUF3604 domain-containing protein n=1 Tax=Aromatoleum toluclasticum TaxID=92003 RepID=UPI001D17D5B4|nr:DUF3604 domain-containing protein [Aromatoleum toluclasticum]MCC4116867.1 DUF3604 domain-containing protein [Aromatoleum toluclasticum]